MRLKLDPESWSVLSRLLDEALELPAEDRLAWVESLDAAQCTLKPQLRLLLSHSVAVETADFLNILPGIEADQGPRRDELGSELGAIVGPYRLIRELGSGGMAAVWLAERADGVMKRPVALKLPHGSYQSARRSFLAERLAREREILAALNHPNIATLYDAGVTDAGQPYLALEYVEGEPIDVYCSNRSLGIPARLGLLLQVARAVAHAHAKLVVHRDLKPSNILVTNDGRVRLLDFGIAKLLDAGEHQAAGLTELSGRALTPDYASPEQILGEPITIASDVYTLGVIAYELLAGHRPYRLTRDSRGALEDAIVGANTRRPSDVAGDDNRKALRGDLDTILLKALKKLPDERYATVNALIDDLERHLSDRPVLARADRFSYRCGKFVARHRVGVSAGGAVAIALLAGAVAALWQTHIANQQRELAQEVERFITSVFSDASPYQQGGKRLTTQELLEHAAARVEDVPSGRVDLRVKLLTLLGTSQLALGDVDAAEANAASASRAAFAGLPPHDRLAADAQLLMADIDRARGRTTEMIARLDLLMAGPPRQAALSSTGLVRALVLKGDVAIDQGHYAEAEAAARRALAIARVSLGDVKAAPAAALMLAESMLYGTHTAEDALAEAEKTLHIVRAAHQRERRHPHVLDARMIYGRALGNADRLEEAIAEIAAAAQVAREVFGAESQTVAFYLQNLARFQRKQGDLRGTLASASEALAIQSKIARHDSFNFLGALFTHAMALGAVRRNVEALDELETVAAGYSAVFGSSHPETLSARINRASLLPYSGRGSEAKAELKRIVDLRRGDDAYRRFVPLFVLGRVYRLEGEYEQALEVQKNARVLLGDDPARLADQVNLAVEVGLASLELGRGAEAREAFEFARANQVPTGSGASPGAADLSLAFARLALLEHDPGRALPLLMEVEEFWRNFDAGNRGAGVAAAWLGRCYLALRDSGAAKSAFARARPLLQVSKLSSDRNLLRLSQAR